MRYYNSNGGVQPIQPLGVGGSTTSPTLATSSQLLNAPSATSSGASNIAGNLQTILTQGASIATTIQQQRAASGLAAERQARIEACGRKGLGYLFSRKKKREYEKCLAEARAYTPKSGGAPYTPPPPPAEKSNNLLFIGLGILAVGGVAYFLLRKK